MGSAAPKRDRAVAPVASRVTLRTRKQSRNSRLAFDHAQATLSMVEGWELTSIDQKSNCTLNLAYRAGTMVVGVSHVPPGTNP